MGATHFLESISRGRKIEFCTYPMGNKPDKSSKNLIEIVCEDDEVEDGEGGLGGEIMQLEDEDQAPKDWLMQCLFCEKIRYKRSTQILGGFA